MHKNMLDSTIGYYQVGEEIYFNKPTALLKSSQTGIHPTWHFHNDVYSQVDWQKDPDLSLQQVYYARARQLREKYDYLVFNFSGGSDSWTALRAFMDQGLHVDEIVSVWAFKGPSNDYQVSTNLNPENVVSEWDLTTGPMLKELANVLPNTKITVVDWSDNVENALVTDSYYETVNDHLNPGWGIKQHRTTETERKMTDAGKSVAVIFGIDKPQIMYKDNNLYAYFLDKIANTRYLRPDSSSHSEFFYWTPDMPEITWTQARLIYQWLKLEPKHLELVDASKPYDRAVKDQWDKVCRALIYPEYVSYNFFQANKPNSLVWHPYDSWLLKLDELNIMKSWRYQFKNLISSIDNKFLDRKNGEIVGLVGMISGPYLIGPISKEITQ